MKKTMGYMIDHITALTSSVWDVLKWRHIIMGFFKEIFLGYTKKTQSGSKIKKRNNFKVKQKLDGELFWSSTQTKKRNSKKRKLNWKTFLTSTISGVIEDLLKLNEKKINFELKIS